MKTTGMDRRGFVAGASLAGFGCFAPIARGAAPEARRRVRLLLNTSWSGPQAWFLLAQDLGYFRREGLEVEMTQGAGAYTAAPRVAAGSFDFGYGDINALIEVSARMPDRAPVAVFVAFNRSPSTIAVDSDGPIRSPKDLEGRTVVGHDTDVALKTFGAFCKANGIDQSKVKIGIGDSMAGMVKRMLGSSDVCGVFGYVSTLQAAIAETNPALARRVRYIRYADSVPDLYGSALFASRAMLKREPETVRGMVKAFNAGLVALMNDQARGLDSVLKRSGTERHVETLRLATTLDLEMGHPDGRRLGIGDVDDARFARSIALLAETNKLPRTPAPSEVFIRDFLPPLSERVTSLGK
ncbi:MAG: ABC transporter substrate-binding protein [Beijerinckiaceae bacterium]